MQQTGVGPHMAEVVIVGAGMAGAVAAFVLGKAGISVVLIDSTVQQAPVFKAEKIEPDQAELLRTFGMMNLLLPECKRIHRIACGQRGRIWGYLDVEQYGCAYHALVNRVRQHLPDSVRVHIARATTLRTSSDLQEVGCADGSVVKGRLLVLANGALTRLQEQIPVQRRIVSQKHSLHLGFDLGPARFFPGQAESLSYREEYFRNAIDFVTLFPIHDTLRINMFTYWDARDSLVRDIRRNGLASLLAIMPRLTKVTGALQLSSKVECMAIDLYRTEHAVIPGVVLLGDAFQSVCPSTGTGLSKVLVDVHTLLRLVPQWLQTSGMSAQKIREFYADERKQRTDRDSLHDALYRRNLCLDPSIGWRLRRWKKYAPRWWAGVTSSAPLPVAEAQRAAEKRHAVEVDVLMSEDR